MPERKRQAKGGKTLSLLREIGRSELPPTQRHVLIAIALYVGWTTRPDRPAGTCTPGIASLAKDTGFTTRTVKTALLALEQSKWLQVERRFAHGEQKTSRYRITPSATASP